MANEEDAKKGKDKEEEAKAKESKEAPKEASKETPKESSKESAKEEAKKDIAEEESKELSTKKLIILMSVAFLTILIITVVLLIVFLKPEKAKIEPVAEKITQTEEKSSVNPTAETKAPEAPKPIPVMQAQFIKIEPSFVVNFANAQNIKFLEVSVTLVTKTDREANLIKANIPFIKDQLVTLFSAQKYDDIRTQQGKSLLRTQALTIVQQILEKESGEKCVSDILFTSFVMQ